MIGHKAIYGCDLVEIVSIIVDDFCDVKMLHPYDKNKIVKVHISQLEII
jgi:hypothetical protein|tara:strand:+ start:680 stop:826 length:147 start_codon:yes stop_codon:yes gene_type:complete